MTSIHIPVVDLSSAIDGTDPDAVAREVHQAISTGGFCQVIGHGIRPELIDAYYAHMDELFARPQAQKDAWKSPSGDLMRGYSRSTKGIEDGAVMESWETASIESPDEAVRVGVDPAYADYFNTFPWPEIPGFRDSVNELFEATKQLGDLMMSLFARSLDLDPTYFAQFFQNDASNFACKYYSASDQLPVQRVLLPEHGDSGVLTLLHQRGSYDGLQVLQLDGRRVTVPVRDDAYVVNVGQLMTRWTNGLFPATPHRVVTPPETDHSRKSIVLFYLPAIDTSIAPLPSCVGAEGPTYPAITPREQQEQIYAAAIERAKRPAVVEPV
ncbi:2-oxoglutarate and iron-dependent oxygenase domain-containing protein [Tsukamurella sp. NPDC003166]|uniref:isopenicillin N synthase family dioxygenase n=1 Tax=Tsukamurella sp. NPDC003166 TaxID=3154444 RepID=UPI0033A4421C